MPQAVDHSTVPSTLNEKVNAVPTLVSSEVVDGVLLDRAACKQYMRNTFCRDGDCC